MAIALAALGSIGIGTVVTTAIAPAPVTVRAALGLDGADPPDLARRRELAVERVVVACMAQRGFAYVPLTDPPPAIPDADLDPVDWAERWGFGVSTSAGRLLATAPVVDVNLELAARLDPPEARRYRAALFGTGPRDEGCRAAGAEAILGLRERLLAPLAGPLSALEHAVAGDPGMTTAEATWATCVRRAADAMGVPAAGRTRARLVPATLDVLARRLAALTPRDRAGLERLREAERRSAVAVARCESAYATDRETIARPYEAAFVRMHRVELRRIGSAIRTAEAALPAVPEASAGAP